MGYKAIFHNDVNDNERCVCYKDEASIDEVIEDAKSEMRENEHVYIESRDGYDAVCNVWSDGTIEWLRTMPELQGIVECYEEFFEYADSCGVGGLL